MDKQQKKYFVIDKSRNGPILVKEGNKYGYISNKGKIRIPFKYEKATPFSEGLAAVCEDNIYKYIRKDGHIGIALEFEDARPFSEGIAAVKKYGYWGYIDKRGRTLIEYRYDEAHDFSEGLAAVCLNGKYLFINEWEDIVQPYTYLWAGSYLHGVAMVRKEDGYYLISRAGLEESEVMREYEVEDYLKEFPFYKPDLRELYSEIIKNRNKVKLKTDPKAIIFISEAKKHSGDILEAGLSLERAIDGKIDAIEKGRYLQAAKYREREKILLPKLKKLLKGKMGRLK